jgi:flavodoxin
MKSLVVFYSLEGNTRLLADAIADAADAKILELKPKKGIRVGGFLKIIVGVFQVMFRRKPKVLPLEKNPEDYDLLFIGTPVWAGTFTPAIRTFFSDVNLNDKKIALFCSYAKDKGVVFDEMKDKLSGNEIVDTQSFKQPGEENQEKDKEENIQAAKRWAKEVITKI